MSYVDSNTLLHRALMVDRWEFLEMGLYSIADINEAVKERYPELCDDSVICNCRFSQQQPEWEHVVRKALLKCRDNENPYKPTVAQIRFHFWAVIPPETRAEPTARMAEPMRQFAR